MAQPIQGHDTSVDASGRRVNDAEVLGRQEPICPQNTHATADYAATLPTHFRSTRRRWRCALQRPYWNRQLQCPSRKDLYRRDHRSGRVTRRVALETYLQDVVLASFPVLGYEESAAHWHGRERARLESLGRPAPYVDGQIAAIAFVNDLALVTANVRYFARFKDVAVETWGKRGR